MLMAHLVTAGVSDDAAQEDGGPLQIACFLVGTDTPSGAIHATMVGDH